MLGRGATAEVYRGLDELLGRQVAVKVFHRGLGDANSVARQRTEMQVLAKLHHPHLITVYDARLGVDHGDGPDGPDDADLTYLVMELVEGGTLANRITPTGMPPVDVARVGAAVAGALAAVHSHDLVHRDIKPANILISTAGDVKLSDFGIARELAAARLTAAADVIGTAAYLSPEQARGAEVGPPTDVYALGLVLLESLTGHREYPGAAVESAVARLLRDPLDPGQPARRLAAAAARHDAIRSRSPADRRGGRGSADRPRRHHRRTAGDRDTAATGSGHPAAAPAKPKSGAGKTFAITLLILAVTAGVIVGIVALIQRNSHQRNTGGHHAARQLDLGRAIGGDDDRANHRDHPGTGDDHLDLIEHIHLHNTDHLDHADDADHPHHPDDADHPQHNDPAEHAGHTTDGRHRAGQSLTQQAGTDPAGPPEPGRRRRAGPLHRDRPSDRRIRSPGVHSNGRIHPPENLEVGCEGRFAKWQRPADRMRSAGPLHAGISCRRAGAPADRQHCPTSAGHA